MGGAVLLPEKEKLNKTADKKSTVSLGKEGERRKQKNMQDTGLPSA